MDKTTLRTSVDLAATVGQTLIIRVLTRYPKQSGNVRSGPVVIGRPSYQP